MIILIILIISTFLLGILMGKSSYIYIKYKTNIYLLMIYFIIIFVYIFKNNSTFPDLPQYFMALYTSQFVEWENIEQLGGFKYGNKFEIGWCILTKLLAETYLSEIFFIFVISSFILFSYLKTFKQYSTCIWFSIIIFILTIFYNSCFILRQHVAVSICILSIPYIEKRDFIKFIIIVLIACTMHQSALIFIIMYFLYNVELNKKYLACFSLFAILLYTFISFTFHYISTLTQSFDTYMLDERSSLGSNLTGVFISFSILIFVYFFYKTKTIDKFRQLILHALLIICLINVIKVGLPGTIGRLANYFTIFYIIGISNSVSLISNRSIKFISILLIVSAYLFLSMQTMAYEFELVPIF